MTTRLLTAIGCLVPIVAVWAAPTQISQESFESGSAGFTTSVAQFIELGQGNLLSDYCSIIPNDGTKISGNRILSGADGTKVFAAEDCDTPRTLPATQGPQEVTLTTNSVNIAGKINTQVRLLMAAPGNASTLNQYDHSSTNPTFINRLLVEASIDGGAFQRIVQFSTTTADTLNTTMSFDSDGNNVGGDVNPIPTNPTILDATLREGIYSIPTGNTVQIRITFETDATGELIVFDNLRIFGETSATSPPALAGVPAGNLVFTEGGSATAIAPAITVTDSDSANLTSASMQITQANVSTEDVLAATPSGAIVAGDIVYTAATGLLTITRSAPVADYQNVLRSVTYRNTNVINPSTNVRRVTFGASDGSNPSNAPIRDINVIDNIVTQSLPFLESFETDGRGTRYAIDGRFNGPSTAIFDRTTLTGATNVDGTMGVASEDTEPNPDTNAVVFQLNTNNAPNVTAKVRLGSAGAVFDTNDIVAIEASVNGGAFSQVAIFRTVNNSVLDQNLALDTDNNGTGDGTALGTAMQDFTFNMPTATTLGLRLRCESNVGGERIFMDRVLVTRPAVSVAVNNLVVIGYNSSEDIPVDSIALLATADIPDNATIHLTDRGWQTSTSSLRPTNIFESTITWVTSGVTAGKIIRISTGTPDAVTVGAVSVASSFIGTSYGTLAGALDPDLTSGDQILIYTTADTTIDGTPTFIHAFNADSPSALAAANDDSPLDGWSDSDTTNTNSVSKLPPGLTAVTATGASDSGLGLATQLGEFDNYVYSGPVTATTRNGWISRVNTFANWTGRDSTTYDLATAYSGLVGVAIGSPPTVTSSTAALLANATTVTINGTNFDSTAGNNTVTFNNSAVGTVTAATSTQLTITFSTKPASAGSLTAIVTTPIGNSGSAVQIATVTPVVTVNTASIATNATTMTISGFGFSPTAGNNTVVFSPSGTGTVNAATATSLTITGLTGLAAGALNAVVTSNSVGSGSAVQVANVTGLLTQFDLRGTAGVGLLPGNETPAVTGGTGGEIGAGITYYDATNTLTLNVGWGSSQGFTDLTSASNNSHIHGPTTSNFGSNFTQTAGVVFTLTRSSNAMTGGTFSPNTVTLTSPQATDLFNGKYYINIHTANNAGGEMRGFLVQANTPPSFTKGADQTVTEDAGAQTIASWATAISPGPTHESAQTVSFTVTGNTNASLFFTQPAVASNGTLTYRPAAEASGSATISIRADDSGSPAASSAVQTFVINVTAVNDPPSFTKGADQTANEDAGAQTVSAWATAISPGPSNESAQAVSFTITNNTNSALFSVAPAVAANGNLTYTPAANANGSATISIRADDNGSPVASSSVQTFVINITAVNDPPSFTKGADQTVNEDAGAQTIASWATAISPGPNESSQTVSFTITNNTNTALFTAQPAVASNGTLTYTPAANANGSATISVRADDNGSPAASSSSVQTFVINVTAVNDPPSFTKGADQSVPQDSGAQTVSAWATAISSGPANESSQTVSFTITNNTNAPLFSAGPAVATNGTLTYTPATGASGSATISIRADDNGSPTASSAVQTFVINVTAVGPANYTVTTASGVLTITDDAGNGDTLSITEPVAGSIRFAATGRTFSVNGGTQINGNSGNLSLTGITSIIVNAAAGADSTNVSSFTTALPSLTINGGTGDDNVNFFGDITFASGNNLDVDLQNDAASPGGDFVTAQGDADVIASGNGTITVRASKYVHIVGGSSLETQHGNLTVEANQQATSSTGNFQGVIVDGVGTMIRSTGVATMLVKGKGGDDGGGAQLGVNVNGGGKIIGGTGGSLDVYGTGGDSTSWINRGVTVYGTGSQITSTGAQVSVLGTAGANGSFYGIGVAVLFSGEIKGHTNALLVRGTGAGAPGSGFNMGIELGGAGTITAQNAEIGIVAEAGPGDPVGGAGSWGLYAGSSSIISASPNSTNNSTIYIDSRTVSIDPSASITAQKSVTFNTGTSINLGSDDAINLLGLTDAELDRVSAPLIKLDSGASSAGTTISAPITRSTATNLILGGATSSLFPTNTGTDLELAGGTLQLQQRLNMPITGQLADAGYPQLKANGLIDLNGVQLDLSGTTNPNGGLFDSYVMVNNDGTDAISGTFSGLPEGSLIPWPPNPLLAAQITYTGGTGNDVMLTLVSALEVTNTNNSGSGSLRQCMATAVAIPGPNTVTFHSSLAGQTITLASEITINDADGVTVEGAGLSGGKVSGNDATRHFSIPNGSTLTLRDLWITNGNGGGADGGALLNDGTCTIERCTFSDNATGSGAAIKNDTGTMQLTQCTLANNTAAPSGGGGAIVNHASLTLTHCTLANNNANVGFGTAIYNTGPLTLSNTIVSGTGVTIFNANTVSLQQVNIITGTLAGTGSVTGPTPITVDPHIGSLSNYGGPTPTMPPSIDSPALDQAGVITNPPTTDQRGSTRPKGIRPDIGAVEGSVLIVTTAADELESPGTGLSLREAVTAAEAGDSILFDRAVFTGSNTITLLYGPLNPQQNCTLDASAIPGGIKIVHNPQFVEQPASQSLLTGQSATFQVTVENFSGGVAYFWRKNGDSVAVFAQAMGIAGVTEANEGLYDVVLTEASTPGTLSTINVTLQPFQATSQPATLNVDTTPVTILRISDKAVIPVGARHTLAVTAIAAGSPPLTYQWSFKGKKITGATKATYDIAKAALTHAGSYSCIVKSGLNQVSTSTELAVVDTKAKIVNLKAGVPFSPKVIAAGNGLSYAWKRDSSVLMESNNTFTIAAVTGGDSGLYTCTVGFLSGGSSTVTSGCNIQLNVTDAIPQLGTFAPPTATIGQTYFYKVPAQNISGAPATSFSLTGALPKGITFNKTTGVFSGRPTVSKPTGYPLTVKAINSKGPSLPATATLSVNVVPSTAVGTFAGPMERSTLNGNLGGRFDLTTTAAGTFSGSISFGAIKRTFKSQLLLSAGTGDVILRGNLPTIKSANNLNLTAYIEVFATEQLARLTLVPPFGAALIIPAWRKVPSTTAATYTLRLDPGTIIDAPHGYGYSTLKATATNTLTISGKLPDNTALTGSTFIGADGQILIYHLLYANKGTFVGQHQLTGTDLTGTHTWNRPSATTGTIYKTGFNPITVTAAGSKHTPPLPGQLILQANSALHFTDGGLTTNFDQPVTVANPKPTGLTNTAVPLAPITNTTKITKFDVKTGALTGSFIIGTRPAPFTGLMVKIGATTEGYGFFLLPTTDPDRHRLSGRVLLGSP